MRDEPTASGMLRIAAPGERASADLHGDETCSFAQVYIPQPALIAGAQALAKRSAFSRELRDPQFRHGDPLLEQLCKGLLEAGESSDPVSRFYADQLGHTLVAHLLYTYGGETIRSGSHTIAKLPEVLSYIDEHLARGLTVAEIASVALVSPYHFARLFRQAVGESPMQYAKRRRVQKATQLIRTTNLSLSEISATLGFADQSHLTRHFHSVLGVTPGSLMSDKRAAQKRSRS